MTLQECKDQIARQKGFSNWQDLVKHQFEHLISRDYDEAVRLYTQEKVKQALELAAGKATAHTESRFESVHYCECCPVVDKSSILSLLPELVNQINKEI